MGRLYTFKEFAKASGVTPQYLYKIAGNGKIKDYIVYEDGKKKIKGEALELFRKADTTVQGEPDAQTILIETLREQLRVKDQELADRTIEIANKDAQIKDLTETIKASTALQYRLQERITQLEQPPEQPQEEQPEQPQEPPQGANNAPQAQPETHAQPKPDQRGLRGWFARFWRQ